MKLTALDCGLSHTPVFMWFASITLAPCEMCKTFDGVNEWIRIFCGGRFSDLNLSPVAITGQSCTESIDHRWSQSQMKSAISQFRKLIRNLG